MSLSVIRSREDESQGPLQAWGSEAPLKYLQSFLGLETELDCVTQPGFELVDRGTTMGLLMYATLTEYHVAQAGLKLAM